MITKINNNLFSSRIFIKSTKIFLFIIFKKQFALKHLRIYLEKLNPLKKLNLKKKNDGREHDDKSFNFEIQLVNVEPKLTNKIHMLKINQQRQPSVN